MNKKEKREDTNLSLLEAVDVLAHIADWDVTELHQQVEVKPDTAQERAHLQKKRSVSLVKPQEKAAAIELVKESFSVILHYLESVFNNSYRRTAKDEETAQKIKTIMILVGEAAKKLDRYTALFYKANVTSVTGLKEYKKLQEFYIRRIARQIDDSILNTLTLDIAKRVWTSKPILKLTTKKNITAKHLYVDLDSVKRDIEYELFLLRKEDGTRFYSPRLLRAIKLVCDFGNCIDNPKHEKANPLDSIAEWNDLHYRRAALHIIRFCGERLNRFYRDAAFHKDNELVQCLTKALIALMMSANPVNQSHEDKKTKKCADYFADFQFFLRQALHTPEYLKKVTYSSKSTHKFTQSLLLTIQGLCMGLFEALEISPNTSAHIQQLIQAGDHLNRLGQYKDSDDKRELWEQLSSDYTSLNILLKPYSMRPLEKILTVLRSGGHQVFDPICQENLPCRQFTLVSDEKGVACIRMPSPTVQEFIQRASVNDEFKAFIRACEHDHLIKHHLLINLQDRTSWKEHARSLSLEELQHHKDFTNHLTVVTLTKDSPFYHQLPPYQDDNHANVFLKHFIEHLEDDQSGFYFPDYVKKGLFPRFFKELINKIHKIFFSEKNVLSREHRLDFIEITYVFLQLKILEIVNPDSFSFACKDGVDTGAAATAQLYTFFNLLNGTEHSPAVRENIATLLYTPCLTIRERIVLVERFNRMISVIKTIELLKDQHGSSRFRQIIHDEIGLFYLSRILDAKTSSEISKI